MNASGPTVNTVKIEDWLFPSLVVLLSVWTAVSNGLLLILCRGLPKWNKERNNLIQYSFFWGEFLFGVGAMVVNLDRLRTLFLNDWCTAFYVLGINFINFCGDLFALSMICVMAFERLIAVAFPFAYRQINKRYLSISLVLLALSFSVVCNGVVYYGVDNGVKPASCTGGSVRIVQLKYFPSYIKCAVGCLTVFIYSLVLLLLQFRMKQKMMAMNVDSSERAIFKSEIKACRIVTVVVVTCFMFAILPNLIVTMLTAQASVYGSVIGPYSILLSLCDSSLNVFLYVWKDEKTRQAFRNFKVVDPNTVHNLTSVRSSQPNNNLD